MFLQNAMMNTPSLSDWIRLGAQGRSDELLQQGQNAIQNGMQARNAVESINQQSQMEAQRAAAEEEAKRQQKLQSLMNMGLSVATGGLGGGAAESAAAVANTAGNAIIDGLKNSSLAQAANYLAPVAMAGLRRVPNIMGNKTVTLNLHKSV